MLSELSAGHGEEMSQLRLELTSRLTDCMETAHHAEIQQAQVCTREENPVICLLFMWFLPGLFLFCLGAPFLIECWFNPPSNFF